ncbi:hypothetical protein RDWZM_008407 [Blomia tropicalis]|uniref:Amino acid transporter transmembrane domain-containing protein n=1 Tax=Blomia tropicalis TaxID=40697 RepID=A0A9Q0M4E3_BLOTA|nr:hypothetical protein RDWZM_008407 [Blomia tropicalis]
MSKLNRSLKSTVNLGNSIIGVSILAMPLCFKHCGIVLSLVVIGISAILNQFSCYLLLKSAIINRRRNYELLAYDVFGSSGKTLVEVCILLYLLGTCIAFFVIVGDIGPSLVAHLLNIENGPHLRALVVTILAMFVIFPLGLMRNVENLTSFSMISLLVYTFLVFRMISLAMDKYFTTPTTINVWFEVNYWNSNYVISYLPIFSMALSCQGQIFEIFSNDLIQTETRKLKYMIRSTRRAIYATSFVYILIGLFGYMAFFDSANLSGNILQALPNGFGTKLTLLMFLGTLLTSFPLCLFPCRTSLHSLLFRKGGYNDLLSTSHSIHMSDHHFRLLTMLLIVTTMGISIIFPHVELVLALVGSTIGAVICFIVPAMIFIKLSDKNTIEYLLSYLLVFFGAIIFVFCTFSALHSISVARDVEIVEKISEMHRVTARPTLPKIKPDENRSKMLKKQPSLPIVTTKSNTEFKSKVNNISKLKESIQLDLKKMKKQDELLQRLERQQQEHSKLLKEQKEIIKQLKSHNQLPVDNGDKSMSITNVNNNKSVDSAPVVISLKITTHFPIKPIKLAENGLTSNSNGAIRAAPIPITASKSNNLTKSMSSNINVKVNLKPVRASISTPSPTHSNQQLLSSISSKSSLSINKTSNMLIEDKAAIINVPNQQQKVIKPIAINMKENRKKDDLIVDGQRTEHREMGQQRNQTKNGNDKDEKKRAEIIEKDTL